MKNKIYLDDTLNLVFNVLNTTTNEKYILFCINYLETYKLLINYYNYNNLFYKCIISHIDDIIYNLKSNLK